MLAAAVEALGRAPEEPAVLAVAAPEEVLEILATLPGKVRLELQTLAAAVVGRQTFLQHLAPAAPASLSSR